LAKSVPAEAEPEAEKALLVNQSTTAFMPFSAAPTSGASSNGDLDAVNGHLDATAAPSGAQGVSTCSLADYADGMWDIHADEPPPSCYAAGLGPVDIRQDCAQTAVDPHRPYERSAWRPQRADCPVFPRSGGQHACPGLANKTVFVLGDSMARNFFEALSCRLRELAPTVNAQMYLQCCQMDSTDKSLQANLLSPETIFAVPSTLKQYRARERLEPAPLGVLIVSTGAWWVPGFLHHQSRWGGAGDPDPWRTTIADIGMNGSSWRAFVYDAVQQRLRALDAIAETGTRVFVRAQDVPHFGANPDLAWSACTASGLPEEAYLTAAAARSETHFLVYSAIKDLLPLFPRLHLLDVTRLTATRSDAHPGAVIQHFRDGKNATADCLHWCIPGVPDVMVQVFLAFACAAE
jgi:hypothetical protein